MATKKKRKNPTDMTLRNTQAANKKFARLTAEIKSLKARVKVLEKASKRAVSRGWAE